MQFSPEPESDALTLISKAFCKDREGAIKARKSQGLDDIWRKAREQYQGIDELNRARGFDAAQTLDGPLTTLRTVKDESRSTVFVNITCPYTDSGTARVSDIYLPTGKMPWKLRNTPVSDIEVIRAMLVQHPEAAESLAIFPELAQRIQQDEDLRDASMERAELIIKDWLKESKWLGELRLLNKEMGQVGTGVMKGPVPKLKQLDEEIESFLSVLQAAAPDAAAELELQLRYTPTSECIKVENCYPAPHCGPDIQNGSFFFEKIPDTSRRQLEDLLDDPNYYADQIQACLEEGPKEPGGQHRDKNRPFDLWVRTGQVKLEGLVEESEITDELSPSIFGTAVICNDRIVKLAPNLLSIDRFPYEVVVWRERENSWAGIGIPESIETPQRGLNASVRAMQDNLGYSVGPQVLLLKGIIEPEDGDWTMYPYKRWVAKVDGITTKIEDVKKAIDFLEFSNYTDQLIPVINFWLKMAEDTTGLPLLLQGQSSSEAVGVSQQLQNNATTNLRLIVKEIDDKCVVPHITSYYDWVQRYGPQDAKGDATVDALGSSVLVIKELQQQALLQIGDRVLQPSYGISPEKWMAAFLEGHQLDPEKLALTDEERERLESAEAQPDPKVQVAQIEAQVDKYVADLRAEMDELKLQLDAQVKGASIEQARETVDTQAAAQIATEEMRQEGKMEEKLMDAELDPELASGLPEGQNAPTLSPESTGALAEPSVDEALSALGFEQ